MTSAMNPASPTSQSVRVVVEGRGVRGEVLMSVLPGTKAGVRDRALDALLATPLGDAAEALGAVLAAAPSAYAFPQPGKDETGRTRFEVRGRVEAERLIPERRPA